MELTSSFSRITAVYRNENYYLSKYLGGRELDLARYLHYFFDWIESEEILERAGIDREELENAQEEGDDSLYVMCDRILSVMSEEEKGEFVETLLSGYPEEAPSWGHMTLENSRLPRNTWLIHFTGQSGSIAEEGFTQGIGEVDRLGLTTWMHENEKKYGGYNFAFIAGDRYSQAAAHRHKYGKQAVMFQSSGVEVYHHGDVENQVIFWGGAIDPSTVVQLDSDGQDWMVVPRNRSSMSQRGRDYVFRGDFNSVVNWVKKNWFQYRRQILGKLSKRTVQKA